MGEARSISLIAIHTHAIPVDFPPEALAEAAAAGAPDLAGREDLRDVPLITIDGADARDFDDAVYAEPVAGGFRLIVAIADVAHYVRAEGALDRSARLRGNSVYFPDRVVPMLPEALSNHWCSLRPQEERACLFAEITIDAKGGKTAHRFGRGLMKSAARLTYEAVQTARDADTDPLTPEGHPAGLPAGLLATLYGAFAALLSARIARGTLDLDLPERQVLLDAEGRIAAVRPRPRLDSHRLIEEFMITANVAAAEELERRGKPCVYRIHAPPSDEKREALAVFLHGLGIALPPGNALHPRDLDAVLRRVAGSEIAPMVNEAVLRSQSQAAYAIENIGHFGLALSRYAHFTSPIRRYADLLVHRALLGALDDAAGLAETAEHITATERRAQLAERDAMDRYLAAFMAERRGAEFAVRISGVTRFGVFVTVLENGASGLVPMSSLPDDEWMHDAATQTLSGRRGRIVLALGAALDVRLAEANPLTGGLIFHPLGLGSGRKLARERGPGARPPGKRVRSR
ncbi:MAG: VacB/RNase II family 3'-5' exoribonuclease, partial [Rhodospirillales bacterium]|nr:VacB/RNase II family 3'-5' exoribonuclease [Rhodospirillales bacterium]